MIIDIALKIFAFLFAILVLISIHEWGHFFVAKRLGIKVLRYSIGFGKPLWRRLGKDGTEYVIAMIPLGGYVKMLDEREGDVLPSQRHLAFNRQSVSKRFAVVFAGPFINLLFAVVAYWLMFVIGIDATKPVIGAVAPQSIAAKANLKVGELIVGIDQHKTDNWQKVLMALVTRLGEEGTLKVVTQPGGSHALQIDDWEVDNITPELLGSLGIKPYYPKLPATFGGVQPDSPAGLAGLKKGDRVLSVDGNKVDSWMQLVRYIKKRPLQKLTLEITRDSQRLSIPVTTGRKFGRGWRYEGYIGVQAVPMKMPANMIHRIQYPMLSAFWPAVKETGIFLKFNAITLKKIIVGQISVRTLGGPITIFKVADRAFKQGVAVYIGFLALISVMLAFVNILPIPALDGGHLLFFLIEAIIRKPIPDAVQILALRIGIIFLVVLMFQATVNDLLRLF